MAGRKNSQDEPHSGRPSAYDLERDIAAVKIHVVKDARYSNEELSNIADLNLSAVFFSIKGKA